MFTHTGLQAPLNETECSGELNLKKKFFLHSIHQVRL